MPGPVNSIRDRIDDLLVERPPTPARILGAVVVFLVAAGGAILFWWPVGHRIQPDCPS